jgi:hypothetical protein
MAEGIIRDWAGGVRTGSWQWRSYYKLATNSVPEVLEDEVPNNIQYTPGGHDVRVDIDTYINDITTLADSSPALASTFTENSSMADMDNVIMSAQIKSSTEDIFAFSTTMATLDPILDTERTFFAGMAKITGGNYRESLTSDGGITKADLNKDGQVDETDLRMILTWFGRPVDNSNPDSQDADLMSTDIIDNDDIDIIRNYWTDNSKQPPIQGDIDYNWVVDQADLNQVMQWYGQAATTQHAHLADWNADGFIDDADVQIVLDAIDEYNNQPTCDDGIQNGDETDIDCSGGCPNLCSLGEMCNENADCSSDNCVANVCEPPTDYDVYATLDVYNDWGSGYCANIEITNYSTNATISWSVTLDKIGGALSGTWNATFTDIGNDEVEVTPTGWNAIIQPGATINSPGFCMNRNGSSNTAEVVDSNGVF